MSTMIEFYLALEGDQAEGESPMTLQVGLRGRDGIVIVSDSLINTELFDPLKIRDFHVHHNETQEKIKIAPSGSIAVSCAWNMRQAISLADAIIKGFSETITPIDDQLRDLARKEMELPTWEDAECLIVISKPEPALFLLQCLKGKNGETDMCNVNWVPFYAFAGNRFLSPTFWVHRFYDTSTTLASTSSLLHLGTQVVVDAEHLSRLTVRGLEAVCCDSSGIRRVPTQKLSELIAASKKRNQRIRRELFS